MHARWQQKSEDCDFIRGVYVFASFLYIYYIKKKQKKKKKKKRLCIFLDYFNWFSNCSNLVPFLSSLPPPPLLPFAAPIQYPGCLGRAAWKGRLLSAEMAPWYVRLFRILKFSAPLYVPRNQIFRSQFKFRRFLPDNCAGYLPFTTWIAMNDLSMRCSSLSTMT